MDRARAVVARLSVDRYTLADVGMAHLPGFSPVMDTDYTKAVQVVASLRAPQDHTNGRSLILQGHVDVVPTGPVDMWSDAAVRAHRQGRAHVRPRRQRHEVGRMRDGVRARCAAHGRISARGRCLRADRHRGGVDRQRRVVDAGARLPRGRLPDPGADRRQGPARHRRRHVVPPAHPRPPRARERERARHQCHPLRLWPDRGAARPHPRAQRAREVASLVQPHPQPHQVQSRQNSRRRLGELDTRLVRGRLPHRRAAGHGARRLPRGAERAWSWRRHGRTRSWPTILRK